MVNTKEKILEICEAIEKLLIEKNKRYGDSAIKPQQIFSKLSAGEAIKVRIDDKISRIINSNELRINDTVDIIGYLILYLVSQNVTETNILKLMD